MLRWATAEPEATVRRQFWKRAAEPVSAKGGRNAKELCKMGGSISCKSVCDINAGIVLHCFPCWRSRLDVSPQIREEPLLSPTKSASYQRAQKKKPTISLSISTPTLVFSSPSSLCINLGSLHGDQKLSQSRISIVKPIRLQHRFHSLDNAAIDPSDARHLPLCPPATDSFTAAQTPHDRDRLATPARNQRTTRSSRL